jgi:hypothetical protein
MYPAAGDTTKRTTPATSSGEQTRPKGGRRFFVAPVDDGHVGAALGRGQGDGPPDAASATGHQRHPSVEIHVPPLPLPRA